MNTKVIYIKRKVDMDKATDLQKEIMKEENYNIILN